jgi:hypothetical protein
MASPVNILQVVQTYQMAGLAALQNLNCFIGTANTKFKNFDKISANLGDTVTFDLNPRFTSTNSLVVAFQPAEQRVQALTVDQQLSTAYEFSVQQFIFQAREYMDKFGKFAIAEIGSKIEAQVARNCVTNTYRFYGDGTNQINSYEEIAVALARYRNYGSANGRAKAYVSDMAVPAIIGTGLSKFAPTRNNEIANSWELGSFSNCDFYQSNLLPVHHAGTAGNQGQPLTVVSFTNGGIGGAIDTITFSGATASDTQAIKKYDKMQFTDGQAGLPNLRFRTFIGHIDSNSPVQMQALSDVAADGAGNVTISINPQLQVLPTNSQNINVPVQVGMKVLVLRSHRAGMITAGDPLFLAMPQLPDESPFHTANMMDPETGVSIRQYYGSRFGENARGMVFDCIWGSTLVAEMSMALIFPL